MQRTSFPDNHQNTYPRDHTNNQFFHLSRLTMHGPQLPHITTPLIYTFSTTYNGPSTPIVVGYGAPRVCLDFHHGAQQPRSSASSPKPHTPSRDSNRGDEVRDGSICTESVVQHSDPFLLRASNLHLQPTSVKISHASTSSSIEFNHESALFLSSPPYGADLCSLV